MNQRIPVALFGLFFGATMMSMPATALWTTADLSVVGQRATIREVVHAHRTTRAVFVDAAARERTCDGAGVEAGDAVAYDDTRCRPVKYLGWPNPMEWVFLGSGATFVLLGVLIGLQRPRRATAPGATPNDVRRVDRGGATTLTLPWRHTVSPAGIVLHLFFIALLSGFAMVALPALVLPAWLAYNLLYTLTNATTIHIAGGGVTIRHVPLPSPNRSVHARLRDLTHLRVERRPQGKQTTYALVAGSVDLLHHWNEAEPLEYVLGCLVDAQRGTGS